MKEDPNKMSTFVHMELSTSDVKAAKEFYQAVFGWECQDMEMPSGSYTMLSVDGKTIGGIQANPMPETPSNWLGYVGVESASRSLSAIESHGGKVIVPVMDIGMGKLAVFVDPQGAYFAIWEPSMPAATEPPSKKTSKKKAAKKAPAKKAAAKKAPAKKAAAEKAPAEKAPAKKAAAKKAPAKKAPAKKAAKKAAAKK